MSAREPLLGSRTIADAVAGPTPTWITLPRSADDVPPELLEAIERFDAGARPAAQAATDWLKTRAMHASLTARTRLYVAEGRVLAFYALASTNVALSQRHRRQLVPAGADPEVVALPGTLVAWLAKDQTSDVDGSVLLLHAAAIARRAAALQATAVLVVDAFDEETERMWRDRFGFRSSGDRPGRLWLPLG